MPIYEFRCGICGELFEVLCRLGESQVAVRCAHCGAEGGDRVLSCVSHTMADRCGDTEGRAELSTRSCPGGSCGAITLPGHRR